MNRIKMISICAMENFRKWKSTPRIWVLALAILVYGIWDFGEMSAYAREVYGGMTSWVLPFWLPSITMVLVFDCITIAFFSNAPFSDSYTPFLVIRVGRLNWILGQICYVFLASIVYVLFYFFVSIICMLPSFNITNEWGLPERAMAAGEVFQTSHSITLRVESYIVDYFNPLEATGIMLLLMWSVSLFTGFLIMLFNMISRGMAGIAIAGTLTFLAYFWYYFGRMWLGEKVFWISPMSWCTLWGVDLWNEGLTPPLAYVLAVLVGFSLVMACISVVLYCKRDITIVKEEF